MKEEYKIALKCMVFGQAFNDMLDRFKGTGVFKHQIKLKGNAFGKEVDKFLDSVYKEAETDLVLIELIEECQKAIDKVIEENVMVVDEVKE